MTIFDSLSWHFVNTMNSLTASKKIKLLNLKGRNISFFLQVNNPVKKVYVTSQFIIPTLRQMINMKKSLLSIKLCWVKDETNVIILQFQYLFCINFTLQNLLIYTHNKNFDVGFGIYLITAWMFALVYIYSEWLMSAWSVCWRASSGLESRTSHPYTRNYSSAANVKIIQLEGLLSENYWYHDGNKIRKIS